MLAVMPVKAGLRSYGGLHFSLYDIDVPLKECKYCKGMQ